ncbi:hypothetical protein DFJ43DRAFT_1055021 [Lentinula guzmanii]|uniref:Transcription factor CBF/NF-Y/archaeal histone domain-containing protein n=1 Tax=Lentinula guzmanii TaxID=2804957 RepID=A0AA38N3H2_9AGAR|nr:hypothetical protein DFJ43DRAFT_1055021 [Lentinula guzmanii]
MDSEISQEHSPKYLEDNDEEPVEERVNADNAVQSEGLPKKKRERKETVPLVRDSGKSLLPFSRVQKIIKADREIPIIARDATFLISLATEEFIKRLCQAGHKAAEKERRTTVQHKDIVAVIRRADEFMFLDGKPLQIKYIYIQIDSRHYLKLEIVSLNQPEPQKRIPKALAASNTVTPTSGLTILDSFVQTNSTRTGSEQSQDAKGSI